MTRSDSPDAPAAASPAQPAILIVDHGSRRDEANSQLERVAELVRERAPGRIVEIAHMELASPSIAEGVARCALRGATQIVVHPYMLAPGRHSALDLPELARRAAGEVSGVLVRVSEPLGAHEKIAEVVLERVAGVEGFE